MDSSGIPLGQWFEQLVKRGHSFNLRYPADSYSAEFASSHQHFERSLQGIHTGHLMNNYGRVAMGKSPIVLLNFSVEEKLQLLMAVTERISVFFSVLDQLTQTVSEHNDTTILRGLICSSQALVGMILSSKLTFDETQMAGILNWSANTAQANKQFRFSHHAFPYKKLVSAIEPSIKANGLSPAYADSMTRLADHLREINDTECRKSGNQLSQLSGDESILCIVAGEAWSDEAIAYLSKQSTKSADAWKGLLEHASTAKVGKPSDKWQKSGAALFEHIDKAEYIAQVNHWFSLVGLPRNTPLERCNEYEPDPNLLIVEENAELLKGLVWICGIMDLSDCATSVGNLGIVAYKKIPKVGPFDTKIGNACIWALGQINGDSVIASLASMKVKIKSRNVQKAITAAMEAIAERLDISTTELQEMGVPDYGLTSVSERVESMGEFTARLSLLPSGKTQLVWSLDSGKTQKSVPKAVKDNFAEELKELRQAGKDATKMLSSIRERLDNLMRTDKQWSYAEWIEPYWNHHLTAAVVRRLIWTFTWSDGRECSGTGLGDDCVDINSNPIDDLHSVDQIRLWHPVNHPEAEVVAWREWFETNEIVQPFKQAHREIYLLTDAEIRTNTYSNRFASHVIKQHQFNALCQTRGWQNQLRLMVDDEYTPPTIELPEFGIRAEYWVEGIGEDYGKDTTEAGSFLYLATDQLRFYPITAAKNSAQAYGGGYRTHGEDILANQPLPLADIPPRQFSEVLRDVDLFVGVASVGNNPEWSDGGPEGRFLEYWNDFGFGELEQMAKSRKSFLHALIPRLKIRNVCEIEGRFLKVIGQLRTYKIHLGSTNVIMEPDNRYLCIVPAQTPNTAVSKVFLPFEGDARLTQILSKAFMLAEDDKITDEYILGQLGIRE